MVKGTANNIYTRHDPSLPLFSLSVCASLLFYLMAINVLACLVLCFFFTSYSGATYCVCKDGISEQLLQKDIDYACGTGADCIAIHEKGACYNPNSVKDHCNYAVNSYFQRKLQVNGSCDFSGTAMISSTPPSGQSTTCVYPSSSTSGTPTMGTKNPLGSGTNSNNPAIFGSPPLGTIGSFDSNALPILKSNLLVSFTSTLLLSYLLCFFR